MTINLAIAKVDELRPNAYDDETKASWISVLDGRIAMEVHHDASFAKYTKDEWDGDLVVPFPYDNIYELYLMAMIDYHNREYGNYNNDMTMFNAALDEYRKYYRRTNTPADSENYKYVF